MRRRLLSLCLMAVMTVMGTSAWALSQTDGVYQINSLEDYLAFASLVNTSPDEGGNPAANAVLNADIDLGTDGTMIGMQPSYWYQGTFDGQGHTITVNAYPTKEDYGLFYRLQNTAEVKNLRVNATITTAQSRAGGLTSYTQGAYIHNCYIDCTINSSKVGDATHAGVVAVAERATFIADCFVKFTMNGVATINCGGIIGWSGNYTTVQNCVLVNETNMKEIGGSGTISRNADANLQGIDPAKYAEGTRPGGASYGNFATAKWDNAKYVTVVGQDGLKDGSVCFQLNSDQSKVIWTQEVGKDDYPLPAPFGSGKQVYASAPTDCQGHVAEGTEVTYSNTASTATCEKHAIDKYGVCPTCGYYDFTLCPKDDKEHKILLKSAADFYLAEGQNRIARGTFYDMVLMADVELSGEGKDALVFNNDNWYGGVFDGQGHSVTINFTDAPNAAALFPELQGTVKNVVLHGTISGSNQYYASVAGHSRAGSTVIENVFSDIQINSTHAGDATIGGIVGVVESNTKLRNVIYAGSIKGDTNSGTTNCAGFCGWSSGRSYMDNCAFTGNITDVSGDVFVASRNPGNVTATNCYYVSDLAQPLNFTKVSADDVKSGKLAFLLNEGVQGADRFYQTINTDAAPVPVANGHGKVYAVSSSFRCDGTPLGGVTYSNDASGVSIPDHQFQSGFCSVCGGIDEHYLTPDAEGCFDIKNGNELAWWSCYAAKYDLGCSARLTADIEMKDEDNEHYATIGTELKPFYGNFYGQYHRISNLHINHDKIGAGLIAVMNSEPKSTGDDDRARAKEPVAIRDVVLDNTCSITGKGYVGIIGMTAPWGGNVLVQNVGMEGDVTATSNANAGGVLGCVMSSACKITIDNSFMAGNVYGVNENGSFSGWLGSFATISNCYAIGTVENPEGVVKDDAGNAKPAEEQTSDRYFARYSSATIRNCFARYGGELKQTVNDKETVVVAKVSEEDVENGNLAYRANGNTSVEPKWYQNLSTDIDQHPMPIPTHGVVFKLAEGNKSAANSDELHELVEAIQAEADDYAETTKAEKAVMDQYKQAAQDLAGLTSVEEVAKAYMDGVLVKKDAAATSAAKYKNYMDEMAKVQAYLDEHDDFSGDERDALEDYFNSADEPSEKYPLGGYLYITEEMLAASDALAGEVTRVNEALQSAIKHGYMPGTEVTGLLANADFLQGKAGWTGAQDLGVATFTIDGKQVAGAERWAGDIDLTQEVADLKEGYYLMEVTGAARPSNDRYGLNYIATLDANGTTNFFMADIEDPISPDEAQDGINCNITGNIPDFPVYEDGVSTDESAGSALAGYVMQGQLSVATVINGGQRYKNYTIAHVGEDGKLTVRLRQDKSGYGSDWFGFGNVRLTYCGDATTDETGAALDDVLASQTARATTIIEKYVPDFENIKKAPGIPTELITQLTAAVNAAQEAKDNESKIAAVQKFSELFLLVREAKAASVKVACTALALTEAVSKMGDIVEDDEFSAVTDAGYTIQNAAIAGEYTLEELKGMTMFSDPKVAAYIPESQDGVMQLATLRHMAYFSAYLASMDKTAKADLVDDIKGFTADMMIADFDGVLDGKFHTIELNVVKDDHENAAIFTNLNGTVKNLIVTGTITTAGKYAAGVASHTYGNSVIDRVTSSVNIVSSVSGDGTHGGFVGVAEGAGAKITNSVFNGTMTGETTDNCGGFVGWSSATNSISNCLMVGDIQVGTSGSYTWARNPDNCSVSNSYYLNAFGTAGGTQTTLEKMKSGELCYNLNGNLSEDPAWFQTLGTDTVPHVTPGATVYYYAGEYVNEKPQIELNSYASKVKLDSDADKVVVSYLLNAPAREGEIRFYKGSEVVYTETLATSDLSTGSHQVTVSNSNLPEAGTALTFDVKVTGYGSKEPARVGEVIKAYDPYGMAVMNDPESAAFGNIYLTESDGNDAGYGVGTGDAGYISDTKHSALYMFSPLFEVVNAADGTPGWKGGMTDGAKVVASNSYPNADYKNVRTSQDGRLFVSRFGGKTDSPIFEVNPTDMEEAWTPVFTGTIDKETGITYAGDEEQARMNVSFDLAGKGENLQLLALGMARSDGGFNYTDYKADIYALGTAKQWTGAPTMNFAPLTGQYTIAPMPVNILSDQRGGAWYVQYRGTPSAVQPAIKHYNAQGVEDFSDISTNLNGGGCAISRDGTLLAVANGANILVFKTDYEVMPNGLINLTPVANFKHLESSISAMAFDFAGNLVVAGRFSATVARYVVPSQTDNITVTPASSRCAFKVGEVKTGLDKIASETGEQRVYNLQGVRLQKAEKGVNIINGKKVMVK